MASQSLTETSASQSLTASGDEIQAEMRELKQRVIFIDRQLRERQHQYRELEEQERAEADARCRAASCGLAAAEGLIYWRAEAIRSGGPIAHDEHYPAALEVILLEDEELASRRRPLVESEVEEVKAECACLDEACRLEVHAEFEAAAEAKTRFGEELAHEEDRARQRAEEQRRLRAEMSEELPRERQLRAEAQTEFEELRRLCAGAILLQKGFQEGFRNVTERNLGQQAYAVRQPAADVSAPSHGYPPLLRGQEEF